MRKRIRRSRRKPIIAIAVASLSCSWVAFAALQDTGFQGAFRFVQRDVGSRATVFDTEDELSQYLVIGFDAPPLLFVISDPRQTSKVN